MHWMGGGSTSSTASVTEYECKDVSGTQPCWPAREVPTTTKQRLQATQGERGERVIEPIKWMGIIRRPCLDKGQWWDFARHRGYTPTLYKKYPGIFNDHRESGPRFNVSSKGRCFLQYSVPVTILGR